MNILDYLSEKQTTSTNNTHPFINASYNFKYLYCYGLGTLAFGYKNNHSDAIATFKSLLVKIQLENLDEDKLITSIKNEFDFKLQDVFRSIRNKEEQYCFIGDLFYIANHANLSPTYSHDIINGYMQIFALDSVEKDFLKRFCSYAAQEENRNLSSQMHFSNKLVSSYYNSYNLTNYNMERKEGEKNATPDTYLPLARSLYRQFLEGGYFLSYKIATYLFPSFTLQESFHSLQIDQGKTVILDYPCYLHGTTIIKNGSALIIKDSNVRIKGNIFIESGKFFIKNSDIVVEGCEENYIVSISETTSVKIENSTVNCNFTAAFLNQDTGCLTLTNSHIKNTTRERAINFAGYSMDLKNCTFSNCMAGGIYNEATRHMSVENCTFSNCEAEHGGGIYSKSLSPSNIASCHYTSCKASYLGSGIYFVNKKNGQKVTNCSFELCSPSDSLVFNDYSETFHA